MSRKSIRDAIAGVVTPALLAHDASTQIFTFKKGAPRHHDPIVCVYLDSGQITNNPGFREDDGELTIDILLPDSDSVDDLLDGFADEVETALDGATIPDTTNLLPTAWQYVRDELPGWTALRLTYSILY